MIDIAQNAPHTLILTEDEAGIYLQASLERVWAVRGQTPIVRQHAGRDSTHFYGTLNLNTGQETVMRSKIMTSEATALHLDQVLAAYPDQSILLIWDRAPWHFGDAVNATLAAHPRLEVMYYPAASPDLNPQEHVWKDARHHVTHNHDMNSLNALADAVEAYLVSHRFPCSLLHTLGYHAILDLTSAHAYCRQL